MTDEVALSPEEARKAWMDEASETWRVSAEIIRKHEDIINPLKGEFARFKIADFGSWVVSHYPQVHFLALDLDFREIEVSEIYDANQEELDDPGDAVREAIEKYVNEHFYRYEFRDFRWYGSDIYIDMLDLREISQWRP